ncbi:MAG: hypothetical protein KatS3mg121_0477 [Gammaproteobacteria bacterium]|nr:MAG: hypothetical protein KatS3mg121_0477 [Gammaproteobacteria bacterium]
MRLYCAPPWRCWPLGVVMVASASTGVSERLTGDPLFLARRHGV